MLYSVGDEGDHNLTFLTGNLISLSDGPVFSAMVAPSGENTETLTSVPCLADVWAVTLTVW